MIQEQLDKILKKKDKQLQSIANKICEATKIKLIEILDKSWYQTYNPKLYRRTYELLNSIDGEVIKHNKCDYSINVYFDTDKIHAIENAGGWNSHAGFNGEKFIDGLIHSIDAGMSGSLLNPRYGEFTNMIELTRIWANDYANKLLKTIL